MIKPKKTPAITNSTTAAAAPATSAMRLRFFPGSPNQAAARAFSGGFPPGGGTAPGDLGWPEGLREWVYRRVIDDGALLNAASTEEGGGSPARGALPETNAVPDGGGYRITGEKTWTTWLPALRYALVSARVGGSRESPMNGGLPVSSS